MKKVILRAYHLAMAALLAASLFSCRGSSSLPVSPVSPTPSELAITPNSLDFGSVSACGTHTREVTLAASDSGSVTISQANVTNAAFTISGLTPPMPLGANQSVSFTVSFTPAGAALATGHIDVLSDASNSPTVLPLRADARYDPPECVEPGP